MILTLIRMIVSALLSLRYRIEVRGLDDIARKGTSRIIFLPNHPTMLDPFIVGSRVHPRFRPHILADADQMSRPFLRKLLDILKIITLPDIGRHGAGRKREVEAALELCAQKVNAGGNLMFYPSGRLYRTRHENIGANSGLSILLSKTPGARVVLVRTTGLWGSRLGFGWNGAYPSVRETLPVLLRALLLSGIFFMPRRRLTMTFFEPADLPVAGGRAVLNRYLESFYNAEAPPNTYVPYTPWEGGGPTVRPEPNERTENTSAVTIPAVVRAQVYERLSEAAGIPVAKIRDDLEFAKDLGLDSLTLVELASWVEAEFGFQAGDAAAFTTVGELLLLASGAAVSQPVHLHPVPPAWFKSPAPPVRATLGEGGTFLEVLLDSARRRGADLPLMADQTVGVRTYRDLITSLLALKPLIAGLPGERIGILMPASVACTTLILACQAAGKVPVLLNWTAGLRTLKHAMDLLGVRHILTARPVLERARGIMGDIREIEPALILMESLRERLTGPRKLGAALRARLGLWRGLLPARAPDTAAILLTSGSESLPKAVPLTHTNILANLRDVLNECIEISSDDVLIGILPPFHSFGLLGCVALPLAAGVRVVYHPNPMDSVAIARTAAAYRASVVLAAPTFLRGIMRVAGREDLATLRLAVVGAEKCPPDLWDMARRHWPQLSLIEGYGTTECAPVIALNNARDPRPGTLGLVIPSMDYVLRHPETDTPAAPGQPGLLLVRGPNVFGGYLNHDGPSPFVSFAGQTWYSTGDLVVETEPRLLTYVGRLKRFVKLGGEMVSLPAVENVLAAAFTPPDAGAPVLAVEAGGAENAPELVLFTTLPLTREQANEKIRAAGLSGLHHIRRVERLDAIPLLGSGKTDYQSLKQRARTPAAP